MSELTESEVGNAPEEVQNVLIDLLKSNCEVLVETEESIALLKIYIP